MSGFDRQQAFVTLLLLAMALFVSTGLPPASRWRRQLRVVALAVFAAAVVFALIEVGIWLATVSR